MINIAIDGPAGAGKSTVAKAAASALGYIYVDTGALYRAVGLFIKENGKNTKSEYEIKPLLNDLKISLKFVNLEQRVFLGERDVTSFIRTPEISMAASDVSAHPAVREFLFDLQRSIARKNNCIMDGRDIGTVVLPKAQVKIFLTASPEERAKRRYNELSEKGQNINYDDVLADVIRRDNQDSNRKIAPLRPAKDAIILDTTDNTLSQSIDLLLKIIKENI
ncbi:MAG: Cytidylate kinase [Firmicutes bacterium ADurb.Bin300]|jgi:cytidylate kinase|nr:MAG: Cytidylate kinase [Firmicutes bacterium ADurb.Bin300]HOD02388.1 (d)CMP kinase [Clostridiales bacterium]